MAPGLTRSTTFWTELTTTRTTITRPTRCRTPMRCKNLACRRACSALSTGARRARGERRDEVRHERDPRQCLRIPAQQRHERYQLFGSVVNCERQDDGLKRNQFGVSLGGPLCCLICIRQRPHVLLFSYQGTRLRQRPSTSNQVVPTAAMRNGDFSSLSTVIKDSSGVPYANNQIPSALFNPVSAKLLNYIQLQPPVAWFTTPRSITMTKTTTSRAATIS